MYVPFIPYETAWTFYTLAQAAKELNTKVSVVEGKCKLYGVPITYRNQALGLDKESFIRLHRRLFDERPVGYRRR